MGTLVGFHPPAVTVFLELVLPDLPEAVAVDVALVVIAADAQASRDGAVGQDGGHVDARAARIVMIAHLAFVRTEEPVTAIVGSDLAFKAGLLDELHHLHELVVGELQVGVVGGTAKGENGEQPPKLDAQRDKIVAETGQVVDVALVHTGDDIPGESGMLLQGLHGHQHVFETQGVAAHPVVVVLEAVEADGDGLQAALHELVEPLGGERHAIGHHAPNEAPFGEGLATGGQVAAHRGLAPGGDDHHVRLVRCARGWPARPAMRGRGWRALAEVAKANVRLPEGPLKAVGEYEVEIALHADAVAKIVVAVVAAAE